MAEAVAGGGISARRVAGWARLRRELDHQELRRQEHERRAEGRRTAKMYREVLRGKPRRR